VQAVVRLLSFLDIRLKKPDIVGGCFHKRMLGSDCFRVPSSGMWLQEPDMFTLFIRLAIAPEHCNEFPFKAVIAQEDLFDFESGGDAASSSCTASADSAHYDAGLVHPIDNCSSIDIGLLRRSNHCGRWFENSLLAPNDNKKRRDTQNN
jgi:hypothetical protein